MQYSLPISMNIQYLQELFGHVNMFSKFLYAKYILLDFEHIIR